MKSRVIWKEVCMAKLYTLPDRFVIYYGNKPVIETTSFVYAYTMLHVLM